MSYIEFKDLIIMTILNYYTLQNEMTKNNSIKNDLHYR
jgi:hypothetical protein